MGRESGKGFRGHENGSETHAVGMGCQAQMKQRVEGLGEGRDLLSVGSGNSTPQRGFSGRGGRRGAQRAGT